MMKALLVLALLVPAAGDEVYTLSGSVKLTGPVPQPKINKAIGQDQACNALHPVPPTKDDIVVDPAGGVKWAFVYVKAGLEGKEYPVPSEPVQIDQVGCTYAPHVAGVRVNQIVNFKNSDPLLHNVHCIPFTNKEFNLGQAQGAVAAKRFALQEVMIKVKCDVHPWMSAWLGVLEHPFFAVTDAEGKFAIKGLPPGKYTIGVWHEKLKFDDQQIEVKAARTLDFSSVGK